MMKYAKFSSSMQVKYQSLPDKLAMQKRVDETVNKITALKFLPRTSTSMFPALRRKWEGVVERGGSFTHLKSQFPLDRKYNGLMALSI